MGHRKNVRALKAMLLAEHTTESSLLVPNGAQAGMPNKADQFDSGVRDADLLVSPLELIMCFAWHARHHRLA